MVAQNGGGSAHNFSLVFNGLTPRFLLGFFIGLQWSISTSIITWSSMAYKNTFDIRLKMYILSYI